MKRGQKPTREQRKFLQLHGFNENEWLISKDTSTQMVLIHRDDNSKTETICKCADDIDE